MTATPTPATLLEDDAPIHAWCIESTDSADWCWSATLDGVKSNAQFLDDGCVPGEPFAVVRKSDHDERIARLLAHIAELDARVEAAERRAAVLEREADTLKTWKSDVIKAAEEAHGPGAFRFKFSLRESGSATNRFPKWLDQRWVSFVYAEDDAHIGYIAKALEAIDAHIAAIASEAGK